MSQRDSESLQWKAEGTAYSTRFDDVYASRAGGVSESREIFWHGNRLGDRSGTRGFCIGELGFGTGQNLLVTLQERRKLPAYRRIHTLSYFSVERYPVCYQDLKTHWKNEPEARVILDRYHHLVHGWNLIQFEDDRVKVMLYIGDVLPFLDELPAAMDAWYLDGFAPQKNPEMWSDQVFRGLSSASKEGTTFSTYTAAGFVRRGLEGWGFEVQKTKGFAHKRERIQGVCRSPRVASRLAPWTESIAPEVRAGQNVAVVGAGIAGLSAAEALTRRGVSVTVLDRHAEVASAASANPVAVLAPLVTARPDTFSRLSYSGFGYTLRILDRLRAQGCLDWNPNGVLHLGFDLKTRTRIQKALEWNPGAFEDLMRAVSAEEASRLIGSPVEFDGVWFKNGGALPPRLLVQGLLKNSNLNLELLNEVPTLKSLRARFDHVVLATAAETARFPEARHLALIPSRGQLVQVHLQTSQESPVKPVVNSDGFIAPLPDGTWVLGSTYELGNSTTEVREAESHALIEKQKTLHPQLFGSRPVEIVSARAAIRCTSSDRLPIVGAIPHAERAGLEIAELKRLRSGSVFPRSSSEVGIWTLTALGSRGLSYGPLMGEVLAARMLGEPIPIARDIWEHVCPLRFLWRGKSS